MWLCQSMEAIGIQWLAYPSCDDEYTEIFFKGYKPHPDGDGSMIWDLTWQERLVRQRRGVVNPRNGRIGSSL